MIFTALRDARRGETYIPRVRSARIKDVAEALIGDRKIELTVTGVRPGEKIHEILVSEEEAHRKIERGGYYVIQPILPELALTPQSETTLDREYSSAENVLGRDEVNEMLQRHNLIAGDDLVTEEDVFE